MWFPGTSFQECYQVLLDLQVTFPKRLSYFKPEDLTNTNENQQNILKNDLKQEKEFNLNENNKEYQLSDQNYNAKKPSYEENKKDYPPSDFKAINLPSNINQTQGNPKELEQIVEEIQISQQNLDNLQEAFIFLLTSKEENEIHEDLNEIIDNFKELKEKRQELCQVIIDFNNQQLEEEFFSRLMEDIEVIDSILSEYEKYIAGALSFKAFRYEFSQYQENPKENIEYEMPLSENQKGNFERIKEEEVVHSRVESLPSNSIRKGSNYDHYSNKELFDEELFQKEVFSNIKCFNDNKRKYLSLTKGNNWLLLILGIKFLFLFLVISS